MNILMYISALALFLLGLAAITRLELTRSQIFLLTVPWWIIAMVILMSIPPAQAESSTVVRPEVSPYSLHPSGIYQFPYTIGGNPHDRPEVQMRGPSVRPHTCQVPVPQQQSAPLPLLPQVRRPADNLLQTGPLGLTQQP